MVNALTASLNDTFNSDDGLIVGPAISLWMPGIPSAWGQYADRYRGQRRSGYGLGRHCRRVWHSDGRKCEAYIYVANAALHLLQLGDNATEVFNLTMSDHFGTTSRPQ